MRTRFAVCLLAALVAAGCNRPKQTCQGSFESYYSALKGHDWDAMYELLTPKFKKKVRSPEVFRQYIADQWAPSKSFEIKVDNLVPAANVCLVSGTMSFVFKVRGKEAEVVEDDYFSWTFRLESDGKWYIELPGEEKLKGF